MFCLMCESASGACKSLKANAFVKGTVKVGTCLNWFRFAHV